MAFTQYPEVITNTSALHPMLVQLNHNVLNGLLGVAIVFSLFVIIGIILLKNSRPTEALTTAAFLCTIVGTMLWVLNLLAFTFVFLFVVITTLGLIGMKLSNN